MNLRHATALAIVGWYLMTPPYDSIISRGSLAYFLVHEDAPISKWNIVDSFDSAVACNNERLGKGRASMTDFPPPEPPREPGEPSLRPKTLKQLQALQDWDAKCIGTDDPRLKEK